MFDSLKSHRNTRSTNLSPKDRLVLLVLFPVPFFSNKRLQDQNLRRLFRFILVSRKIYLPTVYAETVKALPTANFNGL